MSNPLLSPDHLPDFAAIRPEHIQPAITELLAQAQAAQEKVTDPDFPADLHAMERELDVATDALGLAWGAIGHLNAVADTPALREAYNAMLPAVSEFFSGLGSDERLYAKYKAAPIPHDPAEQRALKLALQGFVLGGAELQGEAKERFAAIQTRSAELTQAYSEHVMDATDRFALFVPPERLAGVPEDVVAHAKALAEAEGQPGQCKLTLHFPSYGPVMQYAHDRALREQLYRAYATRASELGDPALDNTTLMHEIVALRHKEAALLGHPHFASVSLVPKMADSAEQVLAFLRDLATKARPFAENDLAAVRAHALTLGLHDLQAWDVSYVSESLKAAQYSYSEQEVRQYLTLPHVLDGLFALLKDVFGLTLTPVEASQASVWHDSVRLLALHRDGQLVGHVYLDLIARPGKRPGAWMDDVRGRWKRPDTGHVQSPVAHLVCNFAPGADGQPSLLTHDDVTTLFHEWGHGLHHLLTQVTVGGVSGIDGVEWDAVELPSQFMENLAWEWPVLERLTKHVTTGEPLPRALFDKMLAAKNFQAGLQTLRQVEFALFDMRLHAEGPQDPLALVQAVRDEVSVLPPPAFNRMPHSFSHIYAGGYAAGYYGYKWAEVLSADCWAAFEEEGTANPATGARFVAEILARGGSRPAMDNFKAFRGREPSIDALLRHQGMALA
ncbi:MAG: M3 family metallopeptidase [Inhella sp.]|uniref:M3 family metallopeptidase n=1 Tax=Inhella sp. TaxID=1921806 RepID=UPI0022C86187|nr:M3 family metallopeptidase [Inhella sp.]MCZ8236628.1 M3 family metallopeptidase [Inhella sp.]